MSFQILAINSGATSTKVAVFRDDERTIAHGTDDLAGFSNLLDQLPYPRGDAEKKSTSPGC